MNTDELITTGSTATNTPNGNRIYENETLKTNSKHVLSSKNNKKTINETATKLLSSSTSSISKLIKTVERTTKRLNLLRQQFQKQEKRSAEICEICLTLSTSLPSISSSSSSTSLPIVLLQNLKPSTTSLPTLSSFECKSHSPSMNIHFTNTNQTNQLNLSTITTTITTNTTTLAMPIRTPTTIINCTNGSKIVRSKTMTTTDESSSSDDINVIKSASSASLSSSSFNNINHSSAETFSNQQEIQIRRSYSMPIIKIDNHTNMMNTMNSCGGGGPDMGCDKSFTPFDDNKMNNARLQQQQQQQEQQQQKLRQDKKFNHEYIPNENSTKINKTTTTTAVPTTTVIKKSTTLGNQQQQRSGSSITGNSNSDDTVDDDSLNHIEHHHHHRDHDDDHNQKQRVGEDFRSGCAHYKRRAMFVTPCCNKFYKCRFCHDENESHHFDRKTLNELICSECNTRQKVQEACIHCGVRFGKYTCLVCNLFDDEEKKQYHCDACGICRIGGAENFFHCKVCNMCLPIQLKIQGHKCVENISRSHCPVCLGDIHTSRIPCHIPDCGHLLHQMCFDQLLASGHYACPTCQTSLIDMTTLWDFLDAQASQMPVPKKYENQKIHIFCNDCQKTSKTNFHFIGLKCMECGAYNTTQDVKRRVSLVPDEPNTA